MADIGEPIERTIALDAHIELPPLRLGAIDGGVVLAARLRRSGELVWSQRRVCGSADDASRVDAPDVGPDGTVRVQGHDVRICVPAGATTQGGYHALDVVVACAGRQVNAPAEPIEVFISR